MTRYPNEYAIYLLLKSTFLSSMACVTRICLKKESSGFVDEGLKCFELSKKLVLNFNSGKENISLKGGTLCENFGFNFYL